VIAVIAMPTSRPIVYPPDDGPFFGMDAVAGRPLHASGYRRSIGGLGKLRICRPAPALHVLIIDDFAAPASFEGE
jgi:hypothetical protein